MSVWGLYLVLYVCMLPFCLPVSPVSCWQSTLDSGSTSAPQEQWGLINPLSSVLIKVRFSNSCKAAYAVSAFNVNLSHRWWKRSYLDQSWCCFYCYCSSVTSLYSSQGSYTPLVLLSPVCSDFQPFYRSASWLCTRTPAHFKYTLGLRVFVKCWASAPPLETTDPGVKR